MKKLWLIAFILLPLVVNACSGNTHSELAPTSGIDAVDAPEDSAAYGRFPEPVSIRVGTHIPAIDNNPVVRYLEDLTNIKIVHSWEAEGDEAYRQMVDMAIASKDLPDVMVVDRNQLRKLTENDMIQDLAQVYQAYASPLVKEIYSSTNGIALQDASTGGKLYALPNVSIDADSPTFLWVRQDWLEKLKLPVPKTLDDLERTAQAFISLDPDGNGKADTVGLAGYRMMVYGEKPAIGGFDAIFHSYGAFPKIWTKDQTGKTVYGSIMPENKQALAKLADWYKRSTIDPSFALNKGGQEPIVTNRTGLFFAPWWVPYWPLGDSIALDPNAEWRAYAVPLDASGQFVTNIAPVTDRYLVVRKGYSHPEAAVRLVNVLSRLERKQDPHKKQVEQLEARATKDGRIVRNYYPFDLLLDYSDSVEKRYNIIELVRQGKKPASELDTESADIYNKIIQNEANPKKVLDNWMISLAYESGVKALVNTPMRKVRGVFYGTTDTMDTRWTYLERLESETFLKIIMGDLPLSAFDDFVAQWKLAGGDQITNEVEHAITGK